MQGSTPIDLAEPDMVKMLEELKKRQNDKPKINAVSVNICHSVKNLHLCFWLCSLSSVLYFFLPLMALSVCQNFLVRLVSMSVECHIWFPSCTNSSDWQSQKMAGTIFKEFKSQDSRHFRFLQSDYEMASPTGQLW